MPPVYDDFLHFCFSHFPVCNLWHHEGCFSAQCSFLFPRRTSSKSIKSSPWFVFRDSDLTLAKVSCNIGYWSPFFFTLLQ